MQQEILYQICPKCDKGAVTFQPDGGYQCDHCGLTLKERSVLGLFKKGHFGVTDLGEGDFTLTKQGLKQAVLTPDVFKIVLGNIYTDQQLAEIAAGGLDTIRPVKTILAEIIMQQLNEPTHLQVSGLRRANGTPIEAGGRYQPLEAMPRSGLEWQDEGNLFGTTRRLVFPSNTFTFIRLGRKVMGVQAFSDGVAVQLKGQDFATCFVGCYPHEAALVAAFVMAKVPPLRQ